MPDKSKMKSLYTTYDELSLVYMYTQLCWLIKDSVFLIALYPTLTISHYYSPKTEAKLTFIQPYNHKSFYRNYLWILYNNYNPQPRTLWTHAVGYLHTDGFVYLTRTPLLEAEVSPTKKSREKSTSLSRTVSCSSNSLRRNIVAMAIYNSAWARLLVRRC